MKAQDCVSLRLKGVGDGEFEMRLDDHCPSYGSPREDLEFERMMKIMAQ